MFEKKTLKSPANPNKEIVPIVKVVLQAQERAK